MFFFKDYVGEDTPKTRARQRGTDFIQTGLLAQGIGSLIAGVIFQPDVPAFWLGLVLIASSFPVLIVGCLRRAASKGYGPTVGVFAAMFGVVGVLFLIVLPDRTRQKFGFDVVQPMKVSTTWMPPDEDPRWNLRSWGEDQFRKPR